MKNFNDLKFHAKMFFPNGYGISVISGRFTFTDSENPYECAVLKGTKYSHSIAYDTPITDDVIGYCNEEKVSEIMKQIQEL